MSIVATVITFVVLLLLYVFVVWRKRRVGVKVSPDDSAFSMVNRGFAILAAVVGLLTSRITDVEKEAPWGIMCTAVILYFCTRWVIQHSTFLQSQVNLR